MDVYNGYSSNHFQHTPSEMSIHELVDCDIKDLDVNYNDPAFDMNVYSDVFQQHMKHEKNLHSPMKMHGGLPADLTNLQWLHSMNVALPVEQGGLHDGTVMVDPNTAMPVQQQAGWQSAGPVTSLAATVMHSSGSTTPLQHHLAVTQALIAAEKPSSKKAIAAKEEPSTGEKIYPKPVFSYSCLIAMALQDSEAGTLPVSEIYKFMQSNFPYFKTAPDGWKNSVRHNLSLNKAFCKMDRPQGTSQRKGCLWTLKPEKKEQMIKEIKKWKKKHAESIKASMARPDEFFISHDDLDGKFCHKRAMAEDHSAAADAAKDLFGHGLMDEINSEAFWDDIMSSSSPDSLKYVDPSFNITHEHYPSEVSTTVEIDSSTQYYHSHEYDHHNIQHVGNYYNTNAYPQTVNY